MGHLVTRRLMTIPAVVIAWIVLTGAFPVLLVAALALDVVRARHHHPFTTTRLLLFGGFYLFAEIVGIVGLTLIWLVGKPLDWILGSHLVVEGSYALESLWARAVFGVVRHVLGLRVEVEGDSVVEPGPILVFVRHASIVDTLLAPVYIWARHGIRLRFVMKRELLVVPCLDIAGNRLPNYFVERRATDKRPEVEGICRLGHGLDERTGVLIYPEGTRYTPEKHLRALEKLGAGDARIFRHARRLRHVLPPRLLGPLALIDATDCDVVFLAHEGLSGFAHVLDIWRKGLVGRTIRLWMWRVPRARIPTDRDQQIDWLYSQWQCVDDWLHVQRTEEEAIEVPELGHPDLLEIEKGRHGSWRRA